MGVAFPNTAGERPSECEPHGRTGRPQPAEPACILRNPRKSRRLLQQQHTSNLNRSVGRQPDNLTQKHKGSPYILYGLPAFTRPPCLPHQHHSLCGGKPVYLHAVKKPTSTSPPAGWPHAAGSSAGRNRRRWQPGVRCHPSHSTAPCMRRHPDDPEPASEFAVPAY